MGNRFIEVELSEVNLVDPDPHYVDPGEAAAAEGAPAKADAAAVLAARKKAHEKTIVSGTYCFLFFILILDKLLLLYSAPQR